MWNLVAYSIPNRSGFIFYIIPTHVSTLAVILLCFSSRHETSIETPRTSKQQMQPYTNREALVPSLIDLHVGMVMFSLCTPEFLTE